jgi:hypothetical protein
MVEHLFFSFLILRWRPLDCSTEKLDSVHSVGLCTSSKYNNQPTIHIPATTPLLANLIMPSPCPPANANNNAALPDIDKDTLQTPTPMTDDLSLPSSKKARTTSISTAMKESQQLKSDNEDIANDNESNVEVIDVDGAVGN